MSFPWTIPSQTIALNHQCERIRSVIVKYKNVSHSIGHFTVTYGSETEGDLVLIQTFLLYYVNQVILMLTIIFQEQFP